MGKTTYTRKRNATRNRIDGVFVENFRTTGSADLTVKEICEKADINRSTFYSYYRDTVDMREQLEERLIAQFKERITPVFDRNAVDPDTIMFEILEFNRENGHLPMLLVSAGSSGFVYGISRVVTDLLTGPGDLNDEARERITMLFTYHFAGISMVMRQMKENVPPTDENYENMARKLVELILPIVKNGLLPTIKEQYQI